MAWIESHQALAQHPKTLRLADELKCSVPAAIGYLHLLWWWALDYAAEGLVREDQQRMVARACLWKGKPELLWKALLDVGFMEPAELPGVVKIHDWMDYAGRLVLKRAANADRMKRARAAHVQNTFEARAGATVPDSTVPTVPNQPDPTPPTPPSDQPNGGACCAQFLISGRFHSVSCPVRVAVEA